MKIGILLGVLILLLLPTIDAKLNTGFDTSNLPKVTLNRPSTTTEGGNSSFNETLLDTLYLRLDATNDPVTNDLDVTGDIGATGTVSGTGGVFTNLGATNLVGNLICILNNTCDLGTDLKRYRNVWVNENVTARNFIGSGKFLTDIIKGDEFDQSLNTTDSVLFNNTNVTTLLRAGQIISGVENPTANFFMDVNATPLEQFVARFSNTRADFAGYQLNAQNPAGQPFIQLHNSGTNVFSTYVMNSSGDFFFKRASAVGADAIVVRMNGGTGADIHFPNSDNMKVGHQETLLRGINFWVVDNGRTVIDPQGGAGTVVQTAEQFIARYIGENAGFAGFQVRATSGTSQPFIQLYNSANNDYYTQQLSTAGDFELRKGTAVGTIVFEADVNNDIRFPLDNQDIFQGAGDDTRTLFNASDKIDDAVSANVNYFWSDYLTYNFDNNFTAEEGYIENNVYYDAFTNESKTDTQGDIISINTCLDKTYYNVTETTGTDAMIINFTFDNVDSFRNIVYCHRYSGTHDLHMSVWNDDLNDFVFLNDVGNTDVQNCNYKSVGGNDDPLINSTGSVKIRIIHPQAGNTNHLEIIDCLRLER